MSVGFLYDDRMDQDIHKLEIPYSKTLKEGSALVTGAIPLYILSRRLLASFKANSRSRVVDAFMLEVIVTTVSTKLFPSYAKYFLGT